MSEVVSLLRLFERREDFPFLMANAGGERQFIDDQVEELIAELPNPPPGWTAPGSFQPDIYRVGENVGDVAVLLDRLLAYRREINSIEADRIRAGLSYLSTMAAAQTEADLEIARATRASDQLQLAIAARKKVIEDAVKAFESEHGVKGSPLNFSERISKLKYQMTMDLVSCYWRSLAIVKGLSAIGKEFNLPFPTQNVFRYSEFPGARFIDEWCGWHRRVAQALEQSEVAETVFEFTVPLGASLQTWNRGFQIFGNRVPVQAPLVADFRARLLDGAIFEFEIKSTTDNVSGVLPPSAGGSPRLLAIGLTAAMPVEAQNDWRFNARVFPPNDVGELMISNVGPSREGPSWFSDGPVFNRIGVGIWSVLLEAALVNGGPGETRHLDRAQWPLTDLHLHLRLVA